MRRPARPQATSACFGPAHRRGNAVDARRAMLSVAADTARRPQGPWAVAHVGGVDDGAEAHL